MRSGCPGSVAVAIGRGNVRDLEAPRLRLPDGPAELLESLEKKRLNVMRLQAACFGPLHVFSNASEPAGVHGLVSEGMVLKQSLNL